MRFLLAMTSAVTLSTSALAQTPEPQRVTISMVVEDAGEVIAKPQLTVLAGETGTVAIDDGNGRSLQVTAVPTITDAGSVLVAVDAERQTTDGETRVRKRLTSAILVEPGKRTLLNFDSTNGPIAPLTIAFTAMVVDG